MPLFRGSEFQLRHSGSAVQWASAPFASRVLQREAPEDSFSIARILRDKCAFSARPLSINSYISSYYIRQCRRADIPGFSSPLATSHLPHGIVSFELSSLKNGINRGIDRDMRHGFFADDVAFALAAGKVQEAADVVILVEAGEEVLCFFRVQRELGQGNSIAKTLGQRGVAFHDLAKVHHRRATNGNTHKRISSGVKTPWNAKPLMSELKLRPPKENPRAQTGMSVPQKAREPRNQPEGWPLQMPERTASEGGPYTGKRNPRAQTGMSVPQKAREPKNQPEGWPLQMQERAKPKMATFPVKSTGTQTPRKVAATIRSTRECSAGRRWRKEKSPKLLALEPALQKKREERNFPPFTKTAKDGAPEEEYRKMEFCGSKLAGRPAIR